MPRLLRQPVFSVAGTEYSWGDVVRAADLRGEWERVIRRTRRALALLERAAEAEEPPVNDERLDEAAQTFRMDRRLMTSEQMEAWLERFGLSVEGWLRALEAELLLAQAPPEEGGDEAAGDADGFEDALFAQAIASGELERQAMRLAGQAAVLERLREAAPQDAGDAGAIAPRETVERRRELFRRLVMQDDEVDAQLRAHQEEYTRVVYKELRLPREEMANEAVLAIQDDGSSISSVASAAHLSREERSAFLKDLSPALAERLFTMSPGELSDVVEDGGVYVLRTLIKKTLPSPQDPEVRGRAADDLLEEKVRRETRERVTWLPR